MPSATWALGWLAGDVVTSAEFAKGAGSIYDTTLGGASATVDITSIIANYAHLLIEVYARSDTAANTALLGMRFNNDAAANYDYERNYGTGATPTSAESFAQIYAVQGLMPAASVGADFYSSHS